MGAAERQIWKKAALDFEPAGFGSLLRAIRLCRVFAI